MKLGVSYNVFDGEELLENSIKQIRELVDHIGVVVQKTSNYGNPCSPELMDIINDLYHNKKLIDHVAIYDPNISAGPHSNEIYKRNLGLFISKRGGCTHHMSMDTDEFYIPEQFEYMKKIVEEGDYDSSACQMTTYYKLPTYRIDPKEDYYVSLIYKIRDNINYNFGQSFPVLVDPTRRMDSGKCKIFTRDDIEMHHMSYIRNDISRKANNSSAKVNFTSSIPYFVEKFNNWKEGDNGILLGLPIKEVDLVKVENIFNI
jgi:hypothetical protein